MGKEVLLQHMITQAPASPRRPNDNSAEHSFLPRMLDTKTRRGLVHTAEVTCRGPKWWKRILMGGSGGGGAWVGCTRVFFVFFSFGGK